MQIIWHIVLDLASISTWPCMGIFRGYIETISTILFWILWMIWDTKKDTGGNNYYFFQWKFRLDRMWWQNFPPARLQNFLLTKFSAGSKFWISKSMEARIHFTPWFTFIASKLENLFPLKLEAFVLFSQNWAYFLMGELFLITSTGTKSSSFEAAVKVNHGAKWGCDPTFFEIKNFHPAELLVMQSCSSINCRFANDMATYHKYNLAESDVRQSEEPWNLFAADRP